MEPATTTATVRVYATAIYSEREVPLAIADDEATQHRESRLMPSLLKAESAEAAVTRALHQIAEWLPLADGWRHRVSVWPLDLETTSTLTSPADEQPFHVDVRLDIKTETGERRKTGRLPAASAE